MKEAKKIKERLCGGTPITTMNTTNNSEALLPPAGSPFVVAPHTLQFRCETAVYCGDSGSSVCYVTCDEVGRFVAAALNHFADSGEMAKYLLENDQIQP